ncbi:MAG: hypothetical protein DRN04_02305 [Thermoprotei archaeon]|nr:MAG: hypothetical protein DRN04_02305 [Thermoprotei archaeon]
MCNLDKAFQKFEECMIKKGKSLSFIKRCRKRLRDVVKVKENMWIVKGRPSLGDWYSAYIVVYIEEKKRYMCSCQSPERAFSGKRRKELCSHVGAVILYNMVHRNEHAY